MEQRDLTDLPAVLDPGDQQARGHLLQGNQLEPVHFQQRIRQVLLCAAVTVREERLSQVFVITVSTVIPWPDWGFSTETTMSF